MFALIRLLFILAVILIGFAAFKYQRTRDRYWIRVITWVLYFVLALLVVFFGGLIIQRAMGYP
ncbi:hypothetical protein JCM19000A_16740 [Silvimonas sp. JCM 19000]